MPRSLSLASQGSVPVRGDLLRAQRKLKFPSAAAFSAACGSVSLPTIYRAEKGGPVLRTYLARMAQELDLPVEKVIAADRHVDRIDTDITLTGKWVGLFVEADRQGQLYIAIEDTELVQNGIDITGESRLSTPDGNRTETFVDCVFKDNVFFGKTIPNDWSFPLDCGAFVLSGTRNLDWMKGYTTWFDFDSELAEVSRFFLFRKSSSNADRYLADAQKALASEMSLFRLRKFVEQGYDFETSVAFLKTYETRQD